MLEAEVLEKEALWEEFNTVFDKVIASPADWGKRDMLRTFCDSLQATPSKDVILQLSKNRVVVEAIPLPGRWTKLFGTPLAYDKDDLLASCSQIIIRGGIFEADGSFIRATKIVIIDGVFLGQQAFSECKEVIIFNGTFHGEQAFNNSQKIIIFGGNFSGNNNFMNSTGTKVFAGTFAGKQSFSHAQGTEIIDGVFKGEHAFEKALQPAVKGGKFLGQFAFSGSVGATVTKGQFSGHGAFLSAKNTVVKGGEMHSEECFKQAENPNVWGGKWFFGDGQPLNTFQHAFNITFCIPTPVESVDSPVHGIFVAQYFNKITNTTKKIQPKNVLFYAIDCRGKHEESFRAQIKIITPQQLAAVTDPVLFDKEYLKRHAQPCYKKGA